MQLDSTPQINAFGYYYYDAVYLIDFIDNPRPEVCSPSFKEKMDIIGMRNFPLFHAHCEETQPQLHLMPRDERLQLKLRLLDELRAKVDQTRQEIAGPKRMRELDLPSDPEECKRKLIEMIDDAQDKIAEMLGNVSNIHKDIAVYRDAIGTLGCVSVNNQQIAAYDEALFKAMPSDGVQEMKKDCDDDCEEKDPKRAKVEKDGDHHDDNDDHE